jgi:chemotaxis protein CheD
VLALFRLLPHKGQLVTTDIDLLGILSVHGATALRGHGAGAPALLVPPAPAASEQASSSGPRTTFLQPGELLASTHPAELSTIVSSGVAVCLWDSRRRSWGMGHYLLAEAIPGQPVSRRLGEIALPFLLGEVLRLGSQPQHLEAKIFGGAAVSAGPRPDGADGLGRKNVELARRVLAESGIPIVAEDVGGTVGRKLSFRTLDGTVLVKPLGLG